MWRFCETPVPTRDHCEQKDMESVGVLYKQIVKGGSSPKFTQPLVVPLHHTLPWVFLGTVRIIS